MDREEALRRDEGNAFQVVGAWYVDLWRQYATASWFRQLDSVVWLDSWRTIIVTRFMPLHNDSRSTMSGPLA